MAEEHGARLRKAIEDMASENREQSRFQREWARACDERDAAERKVVELTVQIDAERMNFKQKFDELRAQQPQTLDQLRAGHLRKSVDDLDLSVRAANCLQALGIGTVRELTNTTFTELLRQKHLTAKVVKEIRVELRKLGLKLKGDK